jgi:hypothetical protein
MKTSHQGFIVPLFLIIVLALIGGGAYVYMQSKKTLSDLPRTATSSDSSDNQESSTSTGLYAYISTSPVQRSNIYKNTDYGFQVTLPTDWSGKYKVDSVDVKRATPTELVPGKELVFEFQKNVGGKPADIEFFSMAAYKLSDWEKICKNNTYEASNSCERNVVGKTSQYVIVWGQSVASETPAGVTIPSELGSYLKENFMALRLSSPVIHSISPASVYAGQSVTITGANFDWIPPQQCQANGCTGHTHVFVYLNGNGIKDGILAEDPPVVGGKIVVGVSRDSSVCTRSQGDGLPCDPARINTGTYTLQMSVEGRGVSNGVPVKITAEP